MGVSAGNEEFQEAVRRAVPEGNTFKGFPIQFNHRNQHNIFVTCLRYEHFCNSHYMGRENVFDLLTWLICIHSVPVCERVTNGSGDTTYLYHGWNLSVCSRNNANSFHLFACNFNISLQISGVLGNPQLSW